MTDEEVGRKIAQQSGLRYDKYMTDAWYRSCGRAARELLSAEAPSTCPAPIHGMTEQEVRQWLFVIWRGLQGSDDIKLVEIAHRIHHLAQPTPAVDPDNEAKALAWLQYQTEQDTSGLFTLDPTSFKSDDDLWETMTEPARNGWRAVAAAKAGKGE